MISASAARPMRFSVSHFISSSFSRHITPHSVLAFVLLWLQQNDEQRAVFA
jgi:hypothetical protein